MVPIAQNVPLLLIETEPLLSRLSYKNVSSKDSVTVLKSYILTLYEPSVNEESINRSPL